MCNTHHSVKASKTSFEECELGGGFNIGTVVKRIKLYNKLIANVI